jgi:acetylornithine deacetylase/succinyl-diaminopimelate desuccinylase-like protein
MIGLMDLVRLKDKYLFMTIDPDTNAPNHIPTKCTAKIDFRCFPHVKEKIKKIADENETSMTKVILDALEKPLSLQL